MIFRPPANQDDFADRPADRDAFLELWNRRSPDLDSEFNYMGDFVTLAALNPNYVDPREEPATGSPAPVPWNGFPRLLSRFYSDQVSEAARAKAEEVADVLTPWLYWIWPNAQGEASLRNAVRHQLPFFAAQLGISADMLADIARPLHAINPDETIGSAIPEFRRQQDEYLEWFVDHNDDGTIQRIILTAEPPDYWSALAEVAPDRVVELYQQHVSSEAVVEELFYPDRVAAFGMVAPNQLGWVEIPNLGGKYNPLNKWTTTQGIMHLTHRANTLGAEVNLAGDASVPRTIDAAPRAPGQDPAPEIERIACARYGGINRSSDPNIGLAVGDLVRAGNRLTLADPVGLYIASVGLNGLRGPRGEVLGSVAGHVVRGADDPFEPRILRYEVRLPDNADFTLSDCAFDNRPLVRGGQIARATTIQLYVNAYSGSADPSADDCEGALCRMPGSDQVFSSASLRNDGAAECPPTGSPQWLLETPDEGDGVLAGPALAGGVNALPVPDRVSGKTALAPPQKGNAYADQGF